MKKRKLKTKTKSISSETLLRTMLNLTDIARIEAKQELYSFIISMLNFNFKVCKYLKMNPEVAENFWRQSIVSTDDPYIKAEAEKLERII